MESTLLRSRILPAFADTVPAGDNRTLRSLCRIILREIPTHDDTAKVLYIGVAGRITTIFDQLYRFLVIRAAGQTFIAFLTAIHRTEQISRMVGNGILAFAVIFVVVIFIYMSMRLQQKQQEERHFIETYTISLVKGFTGDSISLFVNDSLISNKTIIEEPYTVEVGRFAEQSALLIVDNKTELVSTFDLSERGGNYQFEKEEDGIKQLAK